ncbi:hypothetical protein EI983_05785 [Roseovarius faecimaris]|uniref:Uncharacterized protein n=1 Tax=Roseovarius faecimaris TaxID=2494550 RepID=A0A6I6ING6_9RHOB|nr:hypothetical protein [Roseovarius faecimaris]QGX97812.1 hypothetical protein EI983_05785 [Roseovarius faecimaris]
MNMLSPPSATRRQLLLTGLALFLCSPSAAGGDGGGGGNSGLSPRPKQPPATKSKYTQDEFTRLSTAELDQLEWKFTRGKRLHITGFSQNMSDYLILMAVHRRRRTQRLILEMQKLKDDKKRVARLTRERNRVQKELNDLKKARQRAKDKGYTRAAAEAEEQIQKTQKYIKGLDTWIKHPSEGRF